MSEIKNEPSNQPKIPIKEMPVNYNQLLELMAKNFSITEELKIEIHAIRRYMRMRTIISVIWIIVIVAPTIVALFYLPQLLHGYLGMLGGSSNNSATNILDMLKNF